MSYGYGKLNEYAEAAMRGKTLRDVIKDLRELAELKEAGRLWLAAFDLACTIDETTGSERIGQIAGQSNKATADLEAVFRRILGLGFDDPNPIAEKVDKNDQTSQS